MSSVVNRILRALLIIVLIIFNGLFIIIFIFLEDSRELTYSNAGYLYGIIGFILLSLFNFLNRSKKLELLRTFKAEQNIKLNSSIIKSVFIRAFLKKYMLILIFCIWVISLFIIVITANNKMILPLLYTGLGGLLGVILTGWFNHKRIIGNKLLKTEFTCIIRETEIQISSEVLNEVIGYRELVNPISVGTYLFIQTKVTPKYIIIKRK